MSKGILRPADYGHKTGVVRGKAVRPRKVDEKIDFSTGKVHRDEYIDLRDFSDLKQVDKVGKLRKGKERVKIDGIRENLEASFMYDAEKYRKQERNAKNNAKRREKRKAMRKKS
jgi:hypothetical protein